MAQLLGEEGGCGAQLFDLISRGQGALSACGEVSMFLLEVDVLLLFSSRFLLLPLVVRRRRMCKAKEEDIPVFL